MKDILKNTLYASAFLLLLGLSACIDEAIVSGQATEEQVSTSADAQKALVNGLAALMVDNDTYGSDGNYMDWGYPCQMFTREVFGEDIPIYDATYNYFGYVEQNLYLRSFSSYTFYYYYVLIKNANGLIGTIDPETASEESLQYLGMALTYRAMAYMDLARMYEYRKTGIASLDDKAESNGAMGLTVPIVTENTTREQAKHNPRAPFAAMYRFIMDDLRRAETYLAGYSRGDEKAFVDQSVAQGLQARMWLEIGTRFTNEPNDLNTLLDYENSATDGYESLGIASAADCYQNALAAAQRAKSGYSPVTEEQWHNAKTGFNTANQGWMWAAVVGTKEQINYYYYYAFLSQISSEPSWGMPQYGKSFRCIGQSLFDTMTDSDWRKRSWVAPEDVAGENDSDETLAAKRDKYETSLSVSEWKSLPPYANLKFRPGSGDLTDYEIGLVCDIPLMRVEEMYFIEAEAQARLNGYAAGVNVLQNFVNGYRYTDGSYKCSATGIKSFLTQLMIQKRIEFWGEGILFFDYKRLNRPIKRSASDNYLKIYRLDTNEGYVAPWMNYYIPENEQNSNDAIVLNPDPSQAIN